MGVFPGGSVLGLHASTARGLGLISDGRIKILQAAWCGHKREKTKPDSFPKKTYRQPTDTWKAIQHC